MRKTPYKLSDSRGFATAIAFDGFYNCAADYYRVGELADFFELLAG